MNHIQIQSDKDLNHIISSLIFISQAKDFDTSEYDKNMWTICLDPLAEKVITLPDLNNFLSNYLSTKKEQLKNDWQSAPAIFYMWFDAMANQLRLNILSSNRIQLPFACKIEEVDSEIIFKQFLNSQDVISWQQFEEIDENEDLTEEAEFVLKVFIKRL